MECIIKKSAYIPLCSTSLARYRWFTNLSMVHRTSTPSVQTWLGVCRNGGVSFRRWTIAGHPQGMNHRGWTKGGYHRGMPPEHVPLEIPTTSLSCERSWRHSILISWFTPSYPTPTPQAPPSSNQGGHLISGCQNFSSWVKWLKILISEPRPPHASGVRPPSP